MKINKHTIIFFFFLLLTLFCAVFSFSFFSGTPKYNLMNIIIETNVQNKDDILLKIDNKYYIPPQFNNVLSQKISNKVEKIEILIKENFKNDIKNIVVYNDTKTNYFSNFSSFKKDREKICKDNICINYDKYGFNDEIKYNKNSKFVNYNSNLNSFVSFIQLLFEGNKIFVLTYLLLFLTGLYYLNNFKKISFKMNEISIIILILLCAVLLRLNNIQTYCAWWDESYSMMIASAKSPFLNIFSDPGNPPFYYLILKIYNLIFDESIMKMKILSIFIGIVGICAVYYFLKKFINQKSATIGLILSSVNVVLIYYSQEIRCYILQMFYVVLFAYLIFSILEKNKNKYYILYLILSIIAINTHYYQAFLLISNFTFLFFWLLREKRKQECVKFFIVNLISIASFLPYFFFVAFQKGLLNTAFNAQLPQLSFELIKNCVCLIFGGGLSLLFSIIFFIRTILDKNLDFKIKKIVFYCIYSIFSIFLFGIIFSCLIRPMLIERYVVFLIPLYIIFLSIIFSIYSKKEFFVILFVFWIFQMQTYQIQNFENMRKKFMIKNMIFDLSYQYSKIFPNKNTYVILKKMHTNFEELMYKNHYSNNVNYAYIKTSKDPKEITEIFNKKIKEIKKENKNSIIFGEILPSNKYNSNNNNYTCYFNSALDLCIWKIE